MSIQKENPRSTVTGNCLRAAVGGLRAAVGGLQATVVAAAIIASPVTAWAAGGGDETAHQSWSFSGMRGHYEQGQLQRGFQVYKEVCAACHNLRLVKYRNLGDAGGPG